MHIDIRVQKRRELSITLRIEGEQSIKEEINGRIGGSLLVGWKIITRKLFLRNQRKYYLYHLVGLNIGPKDITTACPLFKEKI